MGALRSLSAFDFRHIAKYQWTSHHAAKHARDTAMPIFWSQARLPISYRDEYRRNAMRAAGTPTRSRMDFAHSPAVKDKW